MKIDGYMDKQTKNHRNKVFLLTKSGKVLLELTNLMVVRQIMNVYITADIIHNYIYNYIKTYDRYHDKQIKIYKQILVCIERMIDRW